MSSTRPIWNDGQGLATPDLQRVADGVGAADDRVHEVLFTPGAVSKKIVPLQEETATVNPRLLATQSSISLTPTGVNGAVRVMPCQLIAGSPTSAQAIALAANLQAPLDTPAITSNSSGSIRYDLVYATVTRSVTVTGTRKIKSATDGTLSSQTVNLADAASVTLGVNVGFLTGATAPTTAQINAALPADTSPSSSTFGSFSFPIGYVTVANGYSSGTLIGQDSSGGSTYITQCWPGGFVQGQRVRAMKPASLFYGAANEKFSGTVLAKGVQNAERFGSMSTPIFFLMKLLTSTPTAAGSAVVIDNTIDWRNRFVWGVYSYTNLSGNITLESTVITPASATLMSGGVTGSTANIVYNTGDINPFWTGSGSNAGPAAQAYYSDTAGSTAHSFGLVFKTDGTLAVIRVGSPVDGTNGDLIAMVLYCTDQLKLNG